jgi:hypothetical protein
LFFWVIWAGLNCYTTKDGRYISHGQSLRKSLRSPRGYLSEVNVQFGIATDVTSYPTRGA